MATLSIDGDLVSNKDLISAVKTIRDEVKSLVLSEMQDLEKKVLDLQKAQEESMQKMIDLLKSLPVVQVNVPPPRAMQKDIEYDEYGRPCKIQEKALPS